jgi:hypothetical protein
VNVRQTIGVSLLVVAAILFAQGRGWVPTPGPGPAPSPIPGPGPSPSPIASPFPAADGPWLLVAAEADEATGVLGVGNAKSIHDAVPKNRRVLDYTETDEPEPWKAALAHAFTKGSGKPFFVFRDGARAAEGVLSGTMAEQLATLERAVGVK